MDVSGYRKQYSRQVERAGARKAASDSTELDRASSVAFDKKRTQAARVSQLRALSPEISQHLELVDRLLDLLRDADEPVAVRKVALTLLQQSTFLGPVFDPKRPDYLHTLRSIVDDSDSELRRRVIGILARQKDEYVQRRLIDGLERRAKPLVPEAKAIQFLGYDIHSDHYAVLRRIAEQPTKRPKRPAKRAAKRAGGGAPPRPTRAAREERPRQTSSGVARREAIRVLAADPKSGRLLARILDDKREKPDVRRASAIALQSVAPKKFEKMAMKIALDEKEDDQLRATSISALTHFGKPPSTPKERAFTKGVQKVHDMSASPQVKRAARSYISKFNS